MKTNTTEDFRKNAEKDFDPTVVHAAAVHIHESLADDRKYMGDGDKVKLNLSAIMGYQSWGTMSAAYQEFVLSHKDAAFTVMHDPSVAAHLVCLVEDETDPKWCFYERDLIRLSPSEEGGASAS